MVWSDWVQSNLHGRMSENKEFCSPIYLTEGHDLEDFQSGEEALDSWLQNRALDNMETGASRTYVICPSDSRNVIGYYANVIKLSNKPLIYFALL